MTIKNSIISITIIFLVLSAGIAVPWYLKERKIAQRNGCMNNLRMLTSPMVCCVPLSLKLKDGDALDPKIVCQYMKGATMPTCPAGGKYQVTWIVGGPTPKCSFHGDLLWEMEHTRTLKEMEEAMNKARNAQH